MKKLGRLKLTQLSSEELSKREQNKLRGGYTCCICSCTSGFLGTADTGNAGNRTGVEHDGGGYGSGAFA
mgnify:CR=1 FL=1